MNIFKQGRADLVIFYATQTGIDDCEVTVYENGMTHIITPKEETTCHLMGCEVVWSMAKEEPRNNVRLLNSIPDAEDEE